VHTDDAAAHSARSLGALSYAVGTDIAFAHGHYAPNTPCRRRLLAHELMHVAQQARAPAAMTLSLGPPDSAAEQQAAMVANDVAAGKALTYRPLPTVRSIQRADGALVGGIIAGVAAVVAPSGCASMAGTKAVIIG